ncbi:hypothetical protein HNR59_002475 [Aquamicrobium lusatiense]|uniref:Uncharacterized protein n=1 Tax=Aquamicrobium lusatiense TaxID=89772 RepID=A0A7W9S352_9HYPH|nr:hypothetical protein [Aquamicrobium lusatiense]MBB6013130.1 hypothetical protein [Aquamicrobium lusatiense]
MKSVIVSSMLPLALAISATAILPATASAGERDKQFFQSVEGKWVGPGEIVAGKYKGTKFTCTFTGSSPEVKVGMTLDGSCRVGVFTQQMTATVEHKGRTGYKGTFMGGAAGEGLDIIAGNVVDPRKVVFAINRKELNGVMQARIPDDQSMIVTVSVKVDKQVVPVIGVNLKRIEGAPVGKLAKN